MDFPSSPPFANSQAAQMNQINYQEEFAMDINKRMRVPNSIMVGSGNVNADMFHDPAIVALQKSNENVDWMHVPERICVAGGEKHIPTREPPPEFKLESSFLGKIDDFEGKKQLITPPRVLRIEDVAPAFAENSGQPKRSLDYETPHKPSSAGQFATINEDADVKSNDTIYELEDGEISAGAFIRLRRRYLQLAQRLDTLEIENDRRKRRDKMVYTLGVVYLLFRGIKWFSGQSNYL